MKTINAMQVICRPDFMGNDGVVLAKQAAEALLLTAGNVTIDFDGIHATTPSAVSRFAHYLGQNRPTSDFQRISFVHMSPWVQDTFDLIMEDYPMASAQ